MELGDIPGALYQPFAEAVSADGSVVAGTALDEDGFFTAWRWTEAEGMEFLAPNEYATSATGMSADGKVIVGRRHLDDFRVEGFRWTRGTGLVGLGTTPGGQLYGSAIDASADGSLVVGDANAGDAVLWRVGRPIQDISFGRRFRYARGISADGTVVAGNWDDFGPPRASVLRQGDEEVTSLPIPDGASSTSTQAISADGRVIVGYSWYSERDEARAFRWSRETGTVELGELPGGINQSYAHGASGDGSVVVGESHTGTGAMAGEEAFIWDVANGFRNLKDVLTNEYGLDLRGWTLSHASAISDDGTTIVGDGESPAGRCDSFATMVS